MKPLTHPQQLRSCMVYISEENSRRVHRLIVRLGSIRAATAALGVGGATFAAAREQGRMMKATHDNLLAALDRAEAKAS